MIHQSALNVLFLIDYATFTKDDLKWNNYVFTWIDTLQPILKNSENKLAKEKDNWIVKLKEKRAKLSIRLSDCLNRVRELKQKDRISEAEAISNELKSMSNDIDEFLKEVIYSLKINFNFF